MPTVLNSGVLRGLSASPGASTSSRLASALWAELRPPKVLSKFSPLVLRCHLQTGSLQSNQVKEPNFIGLESSQEEQRHREDGRAEPEQRWE